MQPADPWQLSVLVWIYQSLLHGDNYILAFSRETRCHVIKLIHSLINSNNSPLTIIVVTRQIKMPNILCFQLLKCEDLLFVSLFYFKVNKLFGGSGLFTGQNKQFKATLEHVMGMRHHFWPFCKVWNNNSAMWADLLEQQYIDTIENASTATRHLKLCQLFNENRTLDLLQCLSLQSFTPWGNSPKLQKNK